MVGRDGPMPLAEFEKIIAVNLIGTFNMCARRRRHGREPLGTASAA